MAVAEALRHRKFEWLLSPLRGWTDECVRPSMSSGGADLIYVVMAVRVALGVARDLRRSMAAEIRVMIRPTGRGSMVV